jgi:hypothetical protein
MAYLLCHGKVPREAAKFNCTGAIFRATEEKTKQDIDNLFDCIGVWDRDHRLGNT